MSSATSLRDEELLSGNENHQFKSKLLEEALHNDTFCEFVRKLKILRSDLEEMGVNEKTKQYPLPAVEKIYATKNIISSLPISYQSLGICLLAVTSNKQETYLMNHMYNLTNSNKHMYKYPKKGI
jgi:Leucine-rich repeat (LRR) protein